MNASVRYAFGRLVLTGVLVCSSGLSGCDKRGPPEILGAAADGSVERVKRQISEGATADGQRWVSFKSVVLIGKRPQWGDTSPFEI